MALCYPIVLPNPIDGQPGDPGPERERPGLPAFLSMRARGLEPPRAFGPPAPKARHRRAGPVTTGPLARLERVQAASAGPLLPHLLPTHACRLPTRVTSSGTSRARRLAVPLW